jgi:hypothetical protein
MKMAPSVFELLRQSVLGSLNAPQVRNVSATHGADTVIRAACWHGVENHLLLALRQLDDEVFPLDQLQSLYERGTAVHLRAIADLASSAPVLESHHVPALAVKGPVLSQLYPKPDLRAYSDLDMVVPREGFVLAVEALQSAGCTLLDTNWRRIHEEKRTQVHLLAPHGTAIDLHWHLINRGVARRGLTVDVDALFRHARRTLISGVPCLTTDPVDTALHVIVHAGVSGGARLSQLADVRHAIDVADLDWDALAARARSWGAGEMVAIMLARVARVLDAPRAGRTAAALGDQRGWGAFVRSIELRSHPGLHGDNGLVARLTRSARPTHAASTAAALAWLGFQTRGWVSRRLVRRPDSALDEAERLRREYFAAVSGRHPEAPSRA